MECAWKIIFMVLCKIGFVVDSYSQKNYSSTLWEYCFSTEFVKWSVGCIQKPINGPL